MDELTVGEAAAFLGVTIRTLHHWDNIGLLRPGSRTWSDYRLYAEADLARGQRILVFREAGVPLAEIAALLDTDTDQLAELQRQRELLWQRLESVQRMLAAVDNLIIEQETAMTNTPVDPKRVQEILGSNWDPAYAEEAQQKWGTTPEWQQSQAVQDQMTEADWAQVRHETDDFNTALASAYATGVTPGSEQGNALAERHRTQIERWYPCSHERHVLIARGYTADERWQQHYTVDDQQLHGYLVDLINANAATHGVDVANPTW